MGFPILHDYINCYNLYTDGFAYVCAYVCTVGQFTILAELRHNIAGNPV